MPDDPLKAFHQKIATILDPAFIVTGDEKKPYLSDFWHEDKGLAAFVLRPGNKQEVSAIVQAASRHGIGLVPQGGNTGLVAGGIPDQTGHQVLISTERMDKIREFGETGDYLIAEAGAILENVQGAAAQAGRLFPLSLGSQGSCRIGGNISTNAGGINVLRYGMTRQLILGLEVVLSDGQIWDGLRVLKKDNAGYDLKQLFIGAEGSLGIITAAALKLFPIPKETQTIWLGIQTPKHAIEIFQKFQEKFGDWVTSFEILDDYGVDAAEKNLSNMRKPIQSTCPWHLLIDVEWCLEEGLGPLVERLVEDCFEQGLVEDGTIAQSQQQRADFWRIRDGQSESTRTYGGLLRSDVSVPVHHLPDFLDQATAHFQKTANSVRPLPFGHIGDGNIHYNFVIPFERQHDEEFKERLLHDLFELVAQYGGSFSAEHGIGRMKKDCLRQYRSPIELELMSKVKNALDPDHILNPGVIV